MKLFLHSLQLGFINFERKNIVYEAARKMF